jgi:hypothetical protein
MARARRRHQKQLWPPLPLRLNSAPGAGLPGTGHQYRNLAAHRYRRVVPRKERAIHGLARRREGDGAVSTHGAALKKAAQPTERQDRA